MNFEGVMPALVTPLTEKETLNVDVLHKLITSLLDEEADGGIGTSYNIQMPTIKKIFESFKKGNINEARAAQTEADRIINVLLGEKHLIPAVKAVLERKGFDVGNDVFPMKRYSEQEKDEMMKRIYGI